MASVNGNDSKNTLTGTAWGDSMFGYGGDDTLSGGKGNDYIHGGYGVDKIYGGDGDDRMNLTTGPKDYSHRNSTMELLDGGNGRDNAHIDASGSKVDGLLTDTVHVSAMGQGKYSVSLDSDSGYGNALIATTAGVESFTFREDGPLVNFTGNIGSTGPALTVSLTSKDDVFCGGGENATVNLLGGDDRAIVSGGFDTFPLGAGDDIVEFSAFYNGPRNGTITDFKVGEDSLMLSGWSAERPLAVSEDASGTWLVAGDSSLHLLGVHNFDPFAIA